MSTDNSIEKKHIVYPTIIDTLGNRIDGTLNCDFALALDTYQSAKDKFDSIVGPDVSVNIKTHIEKIVSETSSAMIQVLYVLFGGIAIILILLTLVFFGALYWKKDYTNLFILAILILIIAIIVIYLWIQSIYNTSSTKIEKYIENLNEINDNVQNSIMPVLGCVSGFNI
jgi:glucan phosphoethanolaminetransferase (alkaline phosphatase superfamily)